MMAAMAMAVVAAVMAAGVRGSDPVSVELFVMSKCPDAVVCENTFPFSAVSSIANITLQYIASQKSGAFVCLHKEAECEGNMQQLCARHVQEKAGNLQRWWDFVLCQDENRSAIPGNAEACARRVGIDFTQIQKCIDTGIGATLFEASLKYTQALGIRACCTVYIEHKLRCVHDKTWKQCTGGSKAEDFAHTVCDAYTGPSAKPAICG